MGTASGYVDMLLCTNGTLRATGLLFGGASKIIAMHIHHCQGGATPQTRTGDLCSGPPVINFCGDSSHGLIADGANHSEAARGGVPPGAPALRTCRALRSRHLA